MMQSRDTPFGSRDTHLTVFGGQERLETRLFEGLQLFLNLQEFLSLTVLPDLAVFRGAYLSVHVVHYVLDEPLHFLELRKRDRK